MRTDKEQQALRQVASRLAELARLLEKANHDPARVARFLMRCLFTMFAEDMELLPKESFLKLLKSLQGHTAQFVPMVEEMKLPASLSIRWSPSGPTPYLNSTSLQTARTV